MSTQYLLPCNCGKSVPVVPGQAGQHVVCSCGQKLSVPSLRAIRQLPVAKAATVARPVATWSPLKGALFAIGAALVIGGSIVAGHSWWLYSQIATIKPSTEQFDESMAAIDDMEAAELYESWLFIRDFQLEKPGSSPFAVWGGVARDKFHTFLGGLTLAAIGLVVALTPLFLRRG